METIVRRIDMAADKDLNTAIESTCNHVGQLGFRLAGTFTVGQHLVLIFQMRDE